MSLIIRINGDLNISGAVDYGRILFLFFFYAGHLLRIRLIYERTLKRVTIESLNLYLIKKKSGNIISIASI
jgi:hypothetical protein